MATLQSGRGAGMFANMGNVDALTKGTIDRATMLGRPDVDVNDPASLRASATFRAERGDMAGAKQDTQMAQSVERSNQARTQFDQQQEVIAQEKIATTFANAGKDELYDVLVELDYTTEATMLKAGLMNSKDALALYTNHDKVEAQAAKDRVAVTTAAAAETRAQQNHLITTNKEARVQKDLAETADDDVARTEIRLKLAQEAVDGNYNDPTFVQMMRNGLPMSSKEIYAAYDKAYSNSATGMKDKRATIEADGKIEAWILHKPWPAGPEGQAQMQAELASTMKLLENVSSAGRSAWVSMQASNEKQKQLGNKHVWQPATATSRAFAKDQQTLLGDWGTAPTDFAFWEGSTWDGAARPSEQWNRDMQLMMATSVESLTFNNPTLSAGASQDIVLKKFKEIIEREGKTGTRVTVKTMNYYMTNFLLKQRAKGPDAMATAEASVLGNSNSSDYLAEAAAPEPTP